MIRTRPPASLRALLPRVALPAVLAVASMPGCTCRGARNTAGSDAGTASLAPSGASASAATGPSLDASAPVFSAPIAGARAGGDEVVAGLVVSAGAIRVMGVSAGQVSWTVDALKDVAWTPDAELSLQAARGGFALVWRGLHGGKPGRTLVMLGPHGAVLGAPVDVGAAVCIADAGAAWLDVRTSGPVRVLARAFTDAAPRALGSVPTDRDPALVCGDHDVMVLGAGDDDVTLAAFAPDSSGPGPQRVVLRDADFGDDEEREHDAYSVGDDLGLLRVAASGAVALREVPRGGTPTPWRRLKHSVPADDDVVAVDGDADATLIVYTQDADEACPGVGSTAEAVHALRVNRKTGDETLLDLSPADCQRSFGPYWIAATPLGQAVGWIERTAHAAPGTTPVAAASLRLLTAGGTQARRIEQPADAMVDAGCDARGCSLAALVRTDGADAMLPAALRLLPYP